MEFWIASYIRLHKVIEKLNPSIYQLNLSVKLKHVHNSLISYLIMVSEYLLENTTVSLLDDTENQ